MALESKLRLKKQNSDDDTDETVDNVNASISMDRIWNMVNAHADETSNVPQPEDYDINEDAIKTVDEDLQDKSQQETGSSIKEKASEVLEGEDKDSDERVKKFLNGLSKDDLGISKYGTKRSKDSESDSNDDDEGKSMRQRALAQIMGDAMSKSKRGNSAVQDFKKYSGNDHSNNSTAYGVACIVAILIGFVFVAVNAFASGWPIPFIGRYNIVIGLVLIVGGGMFMRAWDQEDKIE